MIYLSWCLFINWKPITGEVKMKKISPDRIVNTIKDNFKGILSKPLLKNLILVTIAMTMSKKLKINEISEHYGILKAARKSLR